MLDARMLIDRINSIDGVMDTGMAIVMEYIKERYDYDWRHTFSCPKTHNTA